MVVTVVVMISTNTSFYSLCLTSCLDLVIVNKQRWVYKLLSLYLLFFFSLHYSSELLRGLY
jgi:hypothetical protein